MRGREVVTRKVGIEKATATEKIEMKITIDNS